MVAFIHCRGHKDKIFVIKWNPHEMKNLVTVGVKHIKFWTQTGMGCKLYVTERKFSYHHYC